MRCTHSGRDSEDKVPSRPKSVYSISNTLISQVNFEVVSHNVNGLGDDRKRRKIFNFMKRHTSSKALACLQETHSTSKTEKLFKYQRRGKVLF